MLISAELQLWVITLSRSRPRILFVDTLNDALFMYSPNYAVHFVGQLLDDTVSSLNFEQWKLFVNFVSLQSWEI